MRLLRNLPTGRIGVGARTDRTETLMEDRLISTYRVTKSVARFLKQQGGLPVGAT